MEKRGKGAWVGVVEIITPSVPAETGGEGGNDQTNGELATRRPANVFCRRSKG